MLTVRHVNMRDTKWHRRERQRHVHEHVVPSPPERTVDVKSGINQEQRERENLAIKHRSYRQSLGLKADPSTTMLSYE
jgi:hypothetical protein